MKKNILWFLFAVLAIAIGLYPLKYLLGEGRVGIINGKPAWLLATRSWHIAFYLHIIFGGLALLVGWMQFSTKLRAKNLSLHRQIGKLYVLSASLSGFSGLFIAFFADGGFWPALGFGSLASIWCYTTLSAYFAIRKKQLEKHQILMVYSYGACFAAVTLRIWLPILILLIGDYPTAYAIVAWWCWIPNLLLAYIVVKRIKERNASSTAIQRNGR